MLHIDTDFMREIAYKFHNISSGTQWLDPTINVEYSHSRIIENTEEALLEYT